MYSTIPIKSFKDQSTLKTQVSKLLANFNEIPTPTQIKRLFSLNHRKFIKQHHTNHDKINGQIPKSVVTQIIRYTSKENIIRKNSLNIFQGKGFNIVCFHKLKHLCSRGSSQAYDNLLQWVHKKLQGIKYAYFQQCIRNHWLWSYIPNIHGDKQELGIIRIHQYYYDKLALEMTTYKANNLITIRIKLLIKYP